MLCEPSFTLVLAGAIDNDLSSPTPWAYDESMRTSITTSQRYIPLEERVSHSALEVEIEEVPHRPRRPATERTEMDALKQWLVIAVCLLILIAVVV